VICYTGTYITVEHKFLIISSTNTTFSVFKDSHQALKYTIKNISNHALCFKPSVYLKHGDGPDGIIKRSQCLTVIYRVGQK